MSGRNRAVRNEGVTLYDVSENGRRINEMSTDGVNDSLG